MKTPSLITILSPELLDRYDLSGKVVVVIDVLRATTTIATALANGAKEIIPVTNVAKCIQLGNQLDAITAGERDGKPAEGLQYGNSPLVFTRDLVNRRTIILTTTNGTKLLQNAIHAGAGKIITGALCNLTSVCEYLKNVTTDIVLACSGWRNRVNIEDTLFAGAVVAHLRPHIHIANDSCSIAEACYLAAQDDLYAFMRDKNASHYHRLLGFGKEKDLEYCLQKDTVSILPVYQDGRLVGKVPASVQSNHS